ncbi:MAG TPA: glycosyltransferase family A protein, partial [Blastocatellia bacterium]|nr:glycosyltransferase family A protein [Blastocatellia bacterium]
GKLTAVLMYEGGEPSRTPVQRIADSSAVAEVLLVGRSESGQPHFEPPAASKARFLALDSFLGSGMNRLLDEVKTDFLLFVLPGQTVQIGHRAIERFIAVAEDSGAGLVYSDFRDCLGEAITDHPLIDYQPGSIRDTFDFGSILVFSMRAVRQVISRCGPVSDYLKWAGLYDLRLKLSESSRPLRIPEPLYARIPTDRRASGERQFDYVDPRNRDYQLEMERVATEHLKRTGAYLAPRFESVPRAEQSFPVRASVVIPVRNRERTIKDAVSSALSQKTSFDFNVIVVDNHSTDRTTEILSGIARQDRRVVHLIPERMDLGIGGCWNEAVFSSHCGEYAVQLDSDDLYAGQSVLEEIVATFERGRYAMVIGSYTIVNFDLETIPPGLIDHREWTRDNGRNNALRINGLGAPRAFYVPVLRRWGLANVSYGEDYSVALRISRQYEIGRIYEPIYFARRWEGNSDAALPIATANRYDAYKDYIRTVEIAARLRMNDELGPEDNM